MTLPATPQALHAHWEALRAAWERGDRHLTPWLAQPSGYTWPSCPASENSLRHPLALLMETAPEALVRAVLRARPLGRWRLPSAHAVWADGSNRHMPVREAELLSVAWRRGFRELMVDLVPQLLPRLSEINTTHVSQAWRSWAQVLAGLREWEFGEDQKPVSPSKSAQGGGNLQAMRALWEATDAWIEAGLPGWRAGTDRVKPLAWRQAHQATWRSYAWARFGEAFADRDWRNAWLKALPPGVLPGDETWSLLANLATPDSSGRWSVAKTKGMRTLVAKTWACDQEAPAPAPSEAVRGCMGRVLQAAQDMGQPAQTLHLLLHQVRPTLEQLSGPRKWEPFPANGVEERIWESVLRALLDYPPPAPQSPYAASWAALEQLRPATFEARVAGWVCWWHAGGFDTPEGLARWERLGIAQSTIEDEPAPVARWIASAVLELLRATPDPSPERIRAWSRSLASVCQTSELHIWEAWERCVAQDAWAVRAWENRSLPQQREVQACYHQVKAEQLAAAVPVADATPRLRF